MLPAQHAWHGSAAPQPQEPRALGCFVPSALPQLVGPHLGLAAGLGSSVNLGEVPQEMRPAGTLPSSALLGRILNSKNSP